MFQKNQDSSKIQKRIDEIQKILEPIFKTKLEKLNYNCEVCGKEWYSSILDLMGLHIFCEYHFETYQERT